ncbi:MAG: ferredoxin [Acidimicrobiales bacterium]
MEGLRLVVDAARCDGHGICALRCPELVALDEWGYAAVEQDAVTSAATLHRARRALAACPERALQLVKIVPTHAPEGHRVGPVPGIPNFGSVATHQEAAPGAESVSWRVATRRRSGRS